MKEKEYLLIAGTENDYLKMKIIAIFNHKFLDKAIEAYNDCKLPYKEIVETIYG